MGTHREKSPNNYLFLSATILYKTKQLSHRVLTHNAHKCWQTASPTYLGYVIGFTKIHHRRLNQALYWSRQMGIHLSKWQNVAIWGTAFLALLFHFSSGFCLLIVTVKIMMIKVIIMLAYVQSRVQRVCVVCNKEVSSKMNLEALNNDLLPKC